MKMWASNDRADVDGPSDARFTFHRSAVITFRGKVFTGRLVNLSGEGLRIQTAARFTDGDQLEVAVEGWSRLLAKVVWQREGLIGCSFFAQIPCAVLARMIQNAHGIDRIANEVYI